MLRWVLAYLRLCVRIRAHKSLCGRGSFCKCLYGRLRQSVVMTKAVSLDFSAVDHASPSKMKSFSFMGARCTCTWSCLTVALIVLFIDVNIPLSGLNIWSRFVARCCSPLRERLMSSSFWFECLCVFFRRWHLLVH